MRKNLLFFILSFAMTSAFAQVNITFEVNTENITVDPAGLFVAGGSGFGSPGDNQMTDDDGDGIYTITLEREVDFSSHYTFLNGNCPDWSCKENLGGLPCADPMNYNDRFLAPVSEDVVISACFGNCADDGSCVSSIEMVNITFEVNTELIEVDPEGMYLAGGGNFGFPGDNPMSDDDGDGIWSITIEKPMGISSNYTFLNGNCSDWSCKENIAGLPCADPANFNDRWMDAIQGDTTLMACFGTCDTDGSCSIVTDSVSLTFRVNTSDIVVDPEGIFLAAGGNFGVPGDNPMDDSDGDGIFEITVTVPEGFSSHYAFANGNCPDWSCKENLDGLECGDPVSFNDRWLPAIFEDTTVGTYFGACDASNVNGVTIDNNLFQLEPTLVNDFTNIAFGDNAINQQNQIVVMNSVGQVVLSENVQNEAIYRVNTAEYTNGVYFVSVQAGNKMLTKRFVVQK